MAINVRDLANGLLLHFAAFLPGTEALTISSRPRVMRTTILDLPNELLLDIAASLRETKDIHSLLLTNRRLNHLFEARLYLNPPKHLLLRVVRSGNIAAFRRFLEEGLVVKAYDHIPGQVTLLMQASAFSLHPSPHQVEIVRLLLEVVDVSEYGFISRRPRRVLGKDIDNPIGDLFRRYEMETGDWRRWGQMEFVGWGYMHYHPHKNKVDRMRKQ
jgi:hypothetical protein